MATVTHMNQQQLVEFLEQVDIEETIDLGSCSIRIVRDGLDEPMVLVETTGERHALLTDL